jgi:adenylate kinase family enzyme
MSPTKRRKLPAPGCRIVVIGTSGSGKTTMAGALARIFGCPHIELDALHWEPNWTEAELEVFRARADAATSGECWTSDGNYSQVRDIVWGRADTIVWLDYAFATVMYRLLTRTFRRIAGRQELWNGNRESIRGFFFDKESLFVWVLRTHWSRRPRYRRLLRGEYGGKRIVHLTSARQANRWLAAVRRLHERRAAEAPRVA